MFIVFHIYSLSISHISLSLFIYTYQKIKLPLNIVTIWQNFQKHFINFMLRTTARGSKHIYMYIVYNHDINFSDFNKKKTSIVQGITILQISEAQFPYVHSSIIFPTDSLIKLISRRRISDLYLDWNLSDGKYNLHKIINY